MAFDKIFSVSFRTIAFSCLTFVLTSVAASPTGYTETILPEFVSLPPVRQVYISSHTPLPEIRITCHAWPPPPFGNVTYYTRASRTAGGSGPRLHYQIPLHPLASSLMDSNGSTIILSSTDSARSLASSDLHCLASTQFGAVLSPPFRVVLADPNRHSGQLVVQHAVEHWTTVVRCDLPPSTSINSIQFTINGTRIEPTADKYRVIGSPGIPGKFNLVIRAFDGSDVGDYRCFTRDPLTGTDWFDSRRYQLTMHESSLTARNLLSADFPQPTLSSSAYTPNVVVKQGQLVSLLCIPPVPFATNAFWIGRRPPTRASGGRIQLDRQFGILHIAHVTTDDDGAYYCSNGNWTSSLMLKVKRTPQVAVYPPEVRQPPGTEVRLTCVGSESVPPVWYHNGRVLTSTVTTIGSNSSVHIPALSDSTIGVYQCIQPGTYGEDWASAEAIVHYDSDAVLRKADFDRITSESHKPFHLPPIVLSVPTGKSTRLSCTLSGQNHSIPAGVLTSDVLPGVSSAAKRLRLAEALNYVQIHWKKDGVQLQLPTQQSLLRPDEFELDVVRSRDFGVYECTVTTTNSRILFTQVIHVKPSEPWATSQGSNLDPSLSNIQFKSEIQNLANELRPIPGLTNMDDQGDRGKRNTQQALRSSAADPWYSGPVDGLHNEAFQDMNPDAWLNSDPETSGQISRSFSASDSGVSRLSKPNVEPVGDNLAVLISWSPIPTDYYQIQYRHRLPIDQRWSRAFTAESVIKECCGQNPSCCTQQKQFYFTNRQPASLEPGRRYQFRVVAYVQQSIMGKSPWSQTISFEYISKVAPVFTETERLPDGGMVARWTLSTSAVGFPIDHFLLLCRKEERYSNGTVTYSPFQHIFVPGSDTRECKLHNLEPGKGYQLVVYGVHTPPGMDPQAVVFKGGIGGRRITQFSHEIFVKPQIAPGEITVPETHRVNSGTGQARTENQLIFNSTESNRLMFLILGALAGMMLIIMVCLVILCVWRQQRDKRRLLVYTSAAAKQASATKSPPSGQAGHHAAPQNFMLEHLNTLDTHRHRHVSEHSSAFHPQPPPMSPPPPPPKHANQRDVELSSLLSAPPGMYPYPGQLVPSSANLHAPFTNTNPDYAYWVNQHAGAGGTTLPMTGSNYSGQFMVPGNYPNSINSINNQPMNPPFGLKREPPSGGSVHDGTDTECDIPDQGLHQQLGYQVTSVAHSPFPMAGNNASKYQPPSVISMPAMRQPANTAQLIFDPRTQQYHHTLQHISYAQQPHSQWSGYNPGLMTPPPFNEDPNAYPGYGTDTASSGYPPAHLLSSEQQFMLPSFQPYTERYHHLGRQLPNPNAYQPPSLPEGRFLQRSTSMTAQLHYQQQQPGAHTTSQEANQSESLRRATTHVSSSVRGHAPPQETDFADPAPAMAYDTSSARKQRRRRRRLTAELRNQTQPGSGSHGVSEPLMTSSPVTPDTRGSATQTDHGHIAPCLQHAQSSDAKTDCCNPRNGSGMPNGCPEHRTDAPFNTQSELAHPLKAGCTRHPNDELPQPNLHGLQMIPHWPQVLQHHDDPTHFPGLLNHGHHNPSASGSVNRPNWVNGLLPDPPHVRDYSEYGIPNLHTAAVNINDSDANDSPELMTNDGNSVHPKHLTTPGNRPLVANHDSDNFIPC